jgi:hypothetical protein
VCMMCVWFLNYSISFTPSASVSNDDVTIHYYQN